MCLESEPKSPFANDETIDSDKAVEGQSFPAEVTKDILDPEGDVVIRGSRAQIVIRSASEGGAVSVELPTWYWIWPLFRLKAGYTT